MSEVRFFRVRIANVRLKGIAASGGNSFRISQAAVDFFVAEYVARCGQAPRIADVQKMHADRFGLELSKSTAWRRLSAALLRGPSGVRAPPPKTGLSNRPPDVPKTSRFKGVHYAQGHPFAPWKAQIMIAGRRRYLGYFATEEAAAHAYDHAATMAVGDEALTNVRLGLFANGSRR